VTIEPGLADAERVQGNTQICAVVTKDAGYSLSPEIHNRGYAALSLDFIYLRHAIEAPDLAAVIGAVRVLPNYRGLSIGTPHKLEVRRYIDTEDDVARAIGAVNTVLIDRDEHGVATLHGTNTDWYGIARALEVKAGDLLGKSVAIVGAAGAARAAIYAVNQAGMRHKVFNRDDEHLAQLKAELPDTATATLDALEEVRDFDVILHATNVGMTPGDASLIPPDLIRKGQIVFDCVYSAHIEHTELIRQAQAVGATTVEGREMFFWQATQQFRLFTGREPPVNQMRP
jgi:shikimate dehydrogenase